MIPIFKNTGEALEYGRSIAGNPAALEALKAERARLVEEGRKLQDAERWAEALALASGQSQFTREALEAAGLKVL
jgi:hypothetical protein